MKCLLGLLCVCFAMTTLEAASKEDHSSWGSGMTSFVGYTSFTFERGWHKITIAPLGDATENEACISEEDLWLSLCLLTESIQYVDGGFAGVITEEGKVEALYPLKPQPGQPRMVGRYKEPVMSTCDAPITVRVTPKIAAILWIPGTTEACFMGSYKADSTPLAPEAAEALLSPEAKAALPQHTK